MSSSTQSVGDYYGCGDSFLILNILTVPLAERSFDEVNNEISWHVMNNKGSPVPRLVSTQGSLIEDSVPIYRHSSDQGLTLNSWTPTVEEIKRIVVDRAEVDFNHVLIQLYRSGRDNISEHSDKTLDITRGTSICTLSLGAKRTLILRSKCKDTERIVQKIPLPHNSLFVLGKNTNRVFRHSIKECKKADNLKSADELFCKGQRISLTFRSISTFYNKKAGILYGQGAPTKELSIPSLNSVSTLQALSNESNKETKVNSLTSTVLRDQPSCENNKVRKVGESEQRLIEAFSNENRQTNFDWEIEYGHGFPLFYSEPS